MASSDVHGPVDFVIVEFPAASEGSATAAALLDLVERGAIRLFDLLVLRTDADGTTTVVDLEAEGGALDGMDALVGASSGMLGPDDIEAAAAVLNPDTTAAVLVYENTWAIPFVAAARGEGGQLVAGARLTAQEIMDALDAADAAS